MLNVIRCKIFLFAALFLHLHQIFLTPWILKVGLGTEIIIEALPAKYAPTSFLRIMECLKNNNNFLLNFSNWEVPRDARAYYAFLLKTTSKYRNLKAHEAAGYKGPWIENYFISHFIDKPLDYFHGIIPLFVQWVDIRVNELFSVNAPGVPSYKSLVQHMSNILRNDCLYITVSQDDEAIHAIQLKFPNILVFSAGGYGHVPIPLIKGEFEYVFPPSQFSYDVGFYGSFESFPGRSRMLKEMVYFLQARNIRHNFTVPGVHRYKRLISDTLFNLSPRGFGRSAYRTAEIVQIGRIPVYSYDDQPWVPYDGTEKGVRYFGIVGSFEEINSTLHQILISSKNVSDTEKRLTHIRHIRHHYTYAGVLRQIEMFISDPMGPRGGDLRCVAVPSTVR